MSAVFPLSQIPPKSGSREKNFTQMRRSMVGKNEYFEGLEASQHRIGIEMLEDRYNKSTTLD